MDAVIEAQPFGPRPPFGCPPKNGAETLGTLVLWGSGWAFFWGFLRYEAGWLRPIDPNLFHISDYQLYPHDFCPRNYYLKKKKKNYEKSKKCMAMTFIQLPKSLDGNCASLIPWRTWETSSRSRMWTSRGTRGKRMWIVGRGDRASGCQKILRDFGWIWNLFGVPLAIIYFNGILSYFNGIFIYFTGIFLYFNGIFLYFTGIFHYKLSNLSIVGVPWLWNLGWKLSTPKSKMAIVYTSFSDTAI